MPVSNNNQSVPQGTNLVHMHHRQPNSQVNATHLIPNHIQHEQSFERVNSYPRNAFVNPPFVDRISDFNGQTERVRPFPMHHTVSNDSEPPVSNRKTIMPDKFDGRSPLSEYLIHFNICAKLNDWSNKEKAQYLSISLKGNAQKILGGLTSFQLEDFKALVDALSERYETEGQSELFMTQLDSRVKSDKETYQELSDSISRLVLKAYPTAPHDMVRILSLRHFIEAVQNSDLRIKLKLAKLNDIRDAVLLAVNYDAIQANEKARQGSRKNNFLRQVKAQKQSNNAQSSKAKEASESKTNEQSAQRVIRLKDIDQTSSIVTELSDRIERLEQRSNGPKPNPKMFPKNRDRSYAPQNSNYGQQPQSNGYRPPPQFNHNSQNHSYRKRHDFQYNMHCYVCGDDTHYSHNCPDKKDRKQNVPGENNAENANTNQNNNQENY